LQDEKGRTVVAEKDRRDLINLNRLDELLKPKQDGQLARITAITRSAGRIRHEPEVIQEEIVQLIRIQRIAQAQDEECWIVNLKKYLSGDVSSLNAGEVKMCAKLAPEYEVDENNLLFFCPVAKRESEDRDGLMRPYPRDVATRFFTPLPRKPGRKSPRYWQNLSEDQIAIPLERIVSKCAEVCR
jgi:hypothetical protein